LSFHVAEQLSELGQLTFEQQPRVGRQELCDSDRRRVRAMHRAEGVLDEEIVGIGEVSCECRIVLRLPGIEAGVLEDSQTVVRQQRQQAFFHGPKRELRVFAFRPAEVRADGHRLRPALEQQA
jgi:hypothetical protein